MKLLKIEINSIFYINSTLCFRKLSAQTKKNSLNN